MGIIYKVTNKQNGKSYIGKTIQDLNTRKQQHIGSKTKIGFHGALKKYGKDNFDWEIIDESEFEKLNKLEKQYIKKFDTFGNGYNLTKGGEGIMSYNHTDETKRKISESTKKCWEDQEYRKKVNTKERNIKIAETLKGRKNKEHSKKISKIWLITKPNGDILKIRGLKEFCGDTGAFYYGLWRVAQKRQNTYRGWKCEEVVE